MYQWNSAYDRIRNSSTIVWKKQPPTIHLLIPNNTEVNAFATRTTDGYAIAIFDGLRVVLTRLFDTLLADPRSFPAIGNILLETKSETSDAKSFPTVMDRLVGGSCRTPRCEHRAIFAQYMTELSLRFAFQHELAHVLLGHIELSKSSQPLLELRSANKADQPRNQALEMHADENAFQRCFYWILDSLERREVTDPMPLFVKTIDAPFLDFFCATYCLFHLFDSREANTHPSPIHRQIRLALIMDHLAKETGLKLRGSATEIAATVITNVDLYMEDILGMNWSHRRDDTRRILRSQMNELIGPYSLNVVKLYPELNPLAFIDVNPE
jgi:hypothetical protein